MKYRAGIIGAGWIGTGYSSVSGHIEKTDTHMAAYSNHPRIELVAVCDTEPSKPHVTHTDYLEMVKSCNLDIVSICTQPETHREIAVAVAPLVKAVFCEKPIALTMEDADAMILACDDNGTLLQIDHERHFTTPVFRVSRGVIDSGTHMFDLLQDLFGQVDELTPGEVTFISGHTVKLEHIDTSGLPWKESHIFEFDVTHNELPMIRLGVDRLVEKLDNKDLDSNAVQGRESLRLALDWQRLLRTRS